MLSSCLEGSYLHGTGYYKLRPSAPLNLRIGLRLMNEVPGTYWYSMIMYFSTNKNPEPLALNITTKVNIVFTAQPVVETIFH